MNVIVLAGEKKKNRDEASNANSREKKNINPDLLSGEKNKALIKIFDRHMIEYVIDTLKASKLIDKIIVVGPVAELTPVIGDRVEYIIEGTDNIVDNAILALRYFPGEKEMLMVTSDIPMITVEAIEHFIIKSRESKADLCYPVVDKKINDEKYPEVKRTYAKLREGAFTGGNIFYFNPAIVDKCKGFVENMLEYRKSPTKMAKLLGIRFLLKMVLGTLSISTVQTKCEKLMGIKGAVVISPYPEVGNDVDKFSDVDFVERHMRKTQ